MTMGGCPYYLYLPDNPLQTITPLSVSRFGRKNHEFCKPILAWYFIMNQVLTPLSVSRSEKKSKKFRQRRRRRRFFFDFPPKCKLKIHIFPWKNNIFCVFLKIFACGAHSKHIIFLQFCWENFNFNKILTSYLIFLYYFGTHFVVIYIVIPYMFPKNPKKNPLNVNRFWNFFEKSAVKKLFFIKKMQKIRSIIWIAIDIS